MLEHAPHWFDWLVVISAILFSPVLAVFAQRMIDRLREKKERRVAIYMTLMSLRAAPLHPDHVRALNSIDTIFDGGSGQDVKVRDAWTRLLAHVATNVDNPGWQERFADLRTDLYQTIGKAVGYDHSVDYIKTRIYNPQHYLDSEVDQFAIRRGLAQALENGCLRVSLTGDGPQQQAAPQQG